MSDCINRQKKETFGKLTFHEKTDISKKNKFSWISKEKLNTKQLSRLASSYHGNIIALPKNTYLLQQFFSYETN